MKVILTTYISYIHPLGAHPPSRALEHQLFGASSEDIALKLIWKFQVNLFQRFPETNGS